MSLSCSFATAAWLCLYNQILNLRYPQWNSGINYSSCRLLTSIEPAITPLYYTLCNLYIRLLCEWFDWKSQSSSSSSSSMATDEETPLVVEENTSQSRPLNQRRDVHILCWAFLLIFLAYGAVQNLESTINTVNLHILFVLSLFSWIW